MLVMFCWLAGCKASGLVYARFWCYCVLDRKMQMAKARAVSRFFLVNGWGSMICGLLVCVSAVAGNVGLLASYSMMNNWWTRLLLVGQAEFWLFGILFLTEIATCQNQSLSMNAVMWLWNVVRNSSWQQIVKQSCYQARQGKVGLAFVLD